MRIDEIGGMLPPSITLGRYPIVVLYADGRLIMQGPQIEIYPGPALPNLQVTQLTERGVEQVLEWAADAGLVGADRFLGQPMLDASQMTFTVVRPEGRHVTTVADLSVADPETGALRQFQDLILSIHQWLPNDVVGGDQPFAWNRLQILTTPADPANLPDPQLANIVDWPLAPLATLGAGDVDARCAVIEGSDLETLRSGLANVNELTLWRSDDVIYSVQLHPLLPDDEGCRGIAPG